MKMRYPTPDMIEVSSLLEALRGAKDPPDAEDEPTEVGALADVVEAIARAEREREAPRVADDAPQVVVADEADTGATDWASQVAAIAAGDDGIAASGREEVDGDDVVDVDLATDVEVIEDDDGDALAELHSDATLVGVAHVSSPPARQAPPRRRLVAMAWGAAVGLAAAGAALAAVMTLARPTIADRPTTVTVTARVNAWLTAPPEPEPIVAAPVVAPAIAAPEAPAPAAQAAEPIEFPPVDVPAPPHAPVAVAAPPQPVAQTAPRAPAQAAPSPAPPRATASAPASVAASAPAKPKTPPPAGDEFEAAARLAKIANQQLGKSLK